MAENEYQSSQFVRRGYADASDLGWKAGQSPPAYVGVDGRTYKFVVVIRDTRGAVQGWLYRALGGAVAPFDFLNIWND